MISKKEYYLQVEVQKLSTSKEQNNNPNPFYVSIQKKGRSNQLIKVKLLDIGRHFVLTYVTVFGFFLVRRSYLERHLARYCSPIPKHPSFYLGAPKLKADKQGGGY